MNSRANPMESYPYPVEGAQCPLLVAIWPLRYAIGVDPGIDADAMELPPLDGNFPALDAEREQASPMHYSRRLLRDGWLYIWLEEQGRLIEYSVDDAYLSETDRGGPVIDGRKLSYFIMSAGENARLVWTPVSWTDDQFEAAKTQSDVRSRVMRAFTPGQAPVSDFISGQSNTLNISDYQSPDAYEWSTAPATTTRPDFARTIFAMNHCEQQAWALVDDPWGVVQDLAALTRLRQQEHEAYLREHAEDWSTAGVLRSLAESDRQLSQKMNQIADTRRLNEVWHAMDMVEDRYADDIASITKVWAGWFVTVHGQGITRLGTACGHFDITVPAHRDALEDSFAAACLGPAEKPEGIVAVKELLKVPPAPQKPWFLWSVLGVGERLDAARLANMLSLGESVAEAAPDALQEVSRMAQAVVLTASINATASQLQSLHLAPVREPLFAAVAPAAALSMREWPERLDGLSKTIISAALGRSGQQLDVVQATTSDIGKWLGEAVGSPAPSIAASATLQSTKSGHITHFRPSIAEATAAKIATAKPSTMGVASKVPTVASNTQFSAAGARPQLLNLSPQALQQAPLRSLIAVLAAVNLIMAGRALEDEISIQSISNLGSGAFGVTAAGVAIVERIAESDWKRHVDAPSGLTGGAKTQLAAALGAAAWVQALSGTVSAFNIILFGTEAIDAYRFGDTDTARISAGLSAASAGQLALQVKAFRAYRTARAAVMLGQLSALRAGTGVLTGPMGFALIAVATLILSGVIIRNFAQNTPLERWVANTRFGVNPEPWSSSHRDEMKKLYALLYPVTLCTEKYPELNPRTGSHTEVTWIILRLQGQSVLREGMLRFEGQEIWSGAGWSAQSAKTPVSWNESHFDKDAGTRRPQEKGVARYRRVYHADLERGSLVRLEGVIHYSPVIGFELPPAEIGGSAWM